MSPKPLISDNDTLQCRSQLTDLSPSYVFERFYGFVPTEFDFGWFNLSALKEIEKNKEFEYLFGCYSNDEHYDPYDESEFVDEVNSGGGRTKKLFFRAEKDKIIIKVSARTNKCKIKASSDNLTKLRKLERDLLGYQIFKSNYQIGILCGGQDIDVRKIDVDKIDLDVRLNYGEKFLPINEAILNSLDKKNHGVIILHGVSGSGKTSYIKHLAQQSERLFIFVPTNHLELLISPNILPILLNYPNSVLILEDAEKAVISREENNNNSLVSIILNIADGILGSMLRMLLIVTFNTKRENIDEAILRKGRLLTEWEFNSLSIEESQKLLDKLNKNYKAIKPMTLAEIYFVNEENYHKNKESAPIGFK